MYKYQTCLFIKWIKYRFINHINGYDDNCFKPDAPMTRAELVAVVNRLLNIESETDKYIPDVTSQDWFHSDIRKAMTMGIIQGNDNGFINPNLILLIASTKCP